MNVHRSKMSSPQLFRRVRPRLVRKTNVVLTTCPSASTLQVVHVPHNSQYSNKHRELQLHCYELRKNACHLSLMQCTYGTITSKDLAQPHKPIAPCLHSQFSMIESKFETRCFVHHYALKTADFMLVVIHFKRHQCAYFNVLHFPISEFFLCPNRY